MLIRNYSPSSGGTEAEEKINVEAVVKMYAQVVIPLTKEVEIEVRILPIHGRVAVPRVALSLPDTFADGL